MPTVRQQIVDAVLVRLRTIKTTTVVNGSAGYYATDIGTLVFEWRDLSAMPFDQSGASTLEALSVNDFEEVASQENTQAHGKELKFEVRFATNNGSDSQSIAERCRAIIADIERCVGADRKWTVSGTSLAQDTRPPEKNEMGISQQGRLIGAGHVIFAIKYRNTNWNPYVIQA